MPWGIPELGGGAGGGGADATVGGGAGGGRGDATVEGGAEGGGDATVDEGRRPVVTHGPGSRHWHEAHDPGGFDAPDMAASVIARQRHRGSE